MSPLSYPLSSVCDPQYRPKCERCWPLVLSSEHHVGFFFFFLLLCMCHCALFLFPLTLGTALNSFVGVGVASTSSHVSSVPLLPQCNCSPHLILFPLAVKSSPHHIFHSAAEKRSRGKISSSALLHPSACPFTYVYHSICSLSFSPSPHPYHSPFPPSSTSSPNLRLTPLHEVDRAYLCSGKHSFPSAVPPLSSVQSFLPLICSPSHLSALSSFLLFFPISSAQMRCCVQKRVLIASSCPGIRWGKWVCNETENTAVQTHIHTRFEGILVCA